MRRLLSRSSGGNARRTLNAHEAPLESALECVVAELQRRHRLKKILKLVLLAVVFCRLYLWGIKRLITSTPQKPGSAVFPLHARFDILNTFSVLNESRSAQRVTQYSPGLKILGWNDVTRPESYFRGVGPLHNIAFFAEFSVGDKTYFMLIDTGSEVSWLFCEPPFEISKDNPKLAGPHGLYQPSLSSMILYKDLDPSGFFPCYQDQYLCKNICYLGGLVVKVLMVKETFVMRKIDMSTTSGKLLFGCGYSYTGPIDDIKHGVDGILGLMPALFSIPHQLAMTGAIRQVIGVCLKRYSHRPPQQVVGYLSFGDEVISVPEQMTWIQMVDDATAFGFAAAFLKSIQIGTFIHQFGPEGQSPKNAKIVFDTGTTVTYLVPDVYDGLIQYLDKHAAYIGYKPLHGGVFQDSGDSVKKLMENYKMCWYRDLNEMNVLWYDDFENVMFTFQDVVGGIGVAKFHIEPSQYLNIFRSADIDSKTAFICSLFLKNEIANSQSFGILGGMAFQGHLVVFDIDNKKIGWSIEEGCEFSKLQKKILEKRTLQ